MINVREAIIKNLQLYINYRQFRNELAVTNDGLILKQNKIVIPTALRKRIVKLAHKEHQRIEKTKTLLRSKV